MLGFLANGTADTACLLYQRTDVRDLFFELSYPVTNVSTTVDMGTVELLISAQSKPQLLQRA